MGVVGGTRRPFPFFYNNKNDNKLSFVSENITIWYCKDFFSL